MTGAISLEDIHVTFRRPGQEPVVAVDGVSLAVPAGGAVGLVGESGSGKTTVARVIAGIQAADKGIVRLDGEPLALRRTQPQRRAIQLVFQDPYSSLNPRRTVRSVLRELLARHDLARGDAAEQRCVELMGMVGLPETALGRRPSAFSGGQRQRLAIARALVVDPQVIVADEPVSALDVSVQATILQLFARLREELGVGILLISHNLAVVRQLCDEVAVMYGGRIVETGSREEIFTAPRDPYTRALLEAVPRLGITSGAGGGHR